jgi:hypothetical protein
MKTVYNFRFYELIGFIFEIILAIALFGLLVFIILAIFGFISIVSTLDNITNVFCCCCCVFIIFPFGFGSFFLDIIVEIIDVIFEIVNSFRLFLMSPILVKFDRKHLVIKKLLRSYRYRLDRVDLGYYEFKGRLVVKEGKRKRTFKNIKPHVIDEMQRNGIDVEDREEDKYNNSILYKIFSNFRTRKDKIKKKRMKS